MQLLKLCDPVSGSGASRAEPIGNQMMRIEKADNNARLNLIVTEPIHRAVGVAAALDDRSINSWCRQVLRAALRERGFDVGKEAAA